MVRKRSQPTSQKPQAEKANSRPTGTLYLVGVPIGSSDDLTIRACTILKQVSAVAAETPLATKTLLEHHGINATITSYGPVQYEEKIAILLDRLEQGHDIAFVSDSGMPVIHDPGQLLIEAAHRSGVPVCVIPGPSALTAAVALSGYAGDRIVFDGRLPGNRRLLDTYFSKLKKEADTTVAFVRPRSLHSVLKSLARVLPNRSATVAINMTKPDETTYRGDGRSLLKQIGSVPNKSEVTVVLAGVQKNKSTRAQKRKRRVNCGGS